MGTSKANKGIRGLINNPKSGISFMAVAKVLYDFSVDGGVISTIIPKQTVRLPKNAVIVGATINSIVAAVGAGATIGVGTSAGSSTTSILAATAVASFSLNALINGVPVFATPVKLTAEGSVSLTIATTALTAGVIEVVLYYYVANS